MAVVLWTSVDNTTLSKVVGPVLSSDPIEYRVRAVTEVFPKVATGDVVLACGTKALEVLKSMSLVPKGRTITSLREKPVVFNGVNVLLTFDPRITLREYERLPEIQWDMRLAIRLAKTGTMVPELGNYRWVDSFHELIARIEEKYESTGKPVEVSCDLETKSLVPQVESAWIISCGFTVDEGTGDAMYFLPHEKPVRPIEGTPETEMSYWEGVWEQIDWIMNTPKVSLRGANFKYDQNWLIPKWGMHCSNFKFDTALVGSLLDENRSNSLKLHAKVFTNIGGYEEPMNEYDMGSVEKVPKSKLIIYQGGDTDATYRVAKVLKAELLKDKRLANFYVKLLHPSSQVFAKMERNGVLVDLPYYKSLEAELVGEIQRLNKEALGCLPNKLRIKHRDSIDEALRAGKSPFKPKLITEFLFSPNGLNLKPRMLTPKTKTPSTSMDHLMMFEDNPVAANFISSFKEIGSASKTYTTYVVGFLKHLRPDGRFHPTYMLYRGAYGDAEESGTVTGRSSAKDPAVQTIPKHTKWTKKIRRAFIAAPGKVILQLDYSQGELKITAIVADEPTMLKAYLNNEDLHSITAARVNGYTYEDFMLLPEDIRDELRSGGKAGNFGLIYGMQVNGYKVYAQTQFGVYLTDETAFNHRESFFDLYSALPAWHEEYKNFARRWGFVRSPLGRIRHLPLINSPDRDIVSQAERQAINSPIQSCLSDMMQLAMVRIDIELGDQVEMFLMTHDSLAVYVDEDKAIEHAERIKGIMESLPLHEFGWNPPLKFTADGEMGPNLAELKKLKNLIAR